MGTELITNGSFETGTGQSPTGWTGSGLAGVDRTAGLAADGTGYYAFGAASANHGGTVQQSIATEVGKTYTVSLKSGVSWQNASGNIDARLKVEALAGATLIEAQNIDLPFNRSTGWGSYTFTFTATATLTTLKFTDTSPNGQADFDIGLDAISVTEAAPYSQNGEWGNLQSWPILPIHAVMLADGKILTFGSLAGAPPGNSNPPQAAIMYHDIYDPVTGEHHMVDHSGTTPTDIFCSGAILMPGSGGKVLISGGDTRPTGTTNAGVDDTNIFDAATHSMVKAPEGDMYFARWYATLISLPSGQIVVMGGTDAAGGLVTTPEIFTPGEGWRKLTGAANPDDAGYYPRMWVNGNGDITYFQTTTGTNADVEVRILDVSGEGSSTVIGKLPFSASWQDPAIMYENGKVLLLAYSGDLWTMDITGEAPIFVKVGTVGQGRHGGNMTVLADGTVLINGGSSVDNNQAGVNKTAVIWNPDTGIITQMTDEMNPRLYHSTSLLQADGSVISMGGGFAGSSENDYLDAQVYKPPYLFNANGELAVRPVISAAPASVEPGDTFTITVDDASAITKLTFSKTGATTHTYNMDARFTDLEFTRGPNNTLIVKVPDNVNDITAGSWMLFAWNDKGVPSVAPMIAVQPTLPGFDGIGDLRADYFNIDANATTLDQVNFNGPVAHTERDVRIDESGAAAHYKGGPATDFAVKYTGDFTVAKNGQYTLYLTADEAARLYIDGQQVLTQTIGNGTTPITVAVTLTKGEHDLELRYMNGSGTSKLDLDWSGPGFARTQMTFDGADDNLLANGSFEHNDTIGLGKAPFGWTVAGAGGFHRDATLADNGQGYYSLGGFTNDVGGTIQQTFDTVAGQTYTLTFSSGVSFQSPATGNVDAKLLAEILSGTTAIQTQQFQLGATQAAGYNDYTVTFTATGPKTTIKFTDKSPAGQAIGLDVGLDNVVVKPSDGSNGGPVTPPVDPNNLAVNGSFEVGAGTMTMPMAHVMSNGQVPGWTSSANRIEMWMNGYNGVTGTDGKNVVEVDAQNGVLSQTIKTEAGKAYGITFDYAGQAGAIASSAMEVLWNGVVIATINPTDATFKNIHTHAFGTGGNDVLAFRAVAGDTDAIGGLLDKVVVTVSGHAVSNPINGTSGDDYIADTDADDVIKAGAGDDTVVLRNAGNDTVDGEAGNNHVDLEGAASDYTFGRDASGNVTVSSVATGTDTLMNINGFYFYGEERWYDLAALAPPAAGTSNTIIGTTGDDYIADTNANDVIKGGAGDDTIFLGSKGNDTVDGEAGNNHVDLNGAASDYTFGRDANGNATVSSVATGTDTLQNINGFYFYGEERWYDLAALAPPAQGSSNSITGTTGDDYIVDTNANDIIKGGAGDDTIVLRNAGNDTVDGEAGNNHVDLECAAADYTFGRDGNGNVTVSSVATGTDTLMNIKGFYFYGEEQWYDLEALAPPAAAAATSEPEPDLIVPADMHAHA